VEDSGGVKGVTSSSEGKVLIEPVDEEQWMPAEAYSLAHDFRATHGNDLTPQLIN
jgi:hypothetical protein